MVTSFNDIHPDIIRSHILSRLDGRSLSTTATVSSYLLSLCSDDNLWANVSKSTWPSIKHECVDNIISTFPAGHRSFFQDSFPNLITDVYPHHNGCDTHNASSHHCWPSELISAVDIRYQNNIIFSTVQITDTTTDDFLLSPLLIVLKSENQLRRPINLNTDEHLIWHLKEYVTSNWIIIDPALKRAGNLSSIKPVKARKDWTTNETILEYVMVLPAGRDLKNEMVQCKIQVVIGVNATGSDQSGLHVNEVMLQSQDLSSKCLNGSDFLVITQGALLEENNVRRKLVNDEWRLGSYYKEMKRGNNKWVKDEEEEEREFATKMYDIGIVFTFLLSVYFFIILLQLHLKF